MPRNLPRGTKDIAFMRRLPFYAPGARPNAENRQNWRNMAVLLGKSAVFAPSDKVKLYAIMPRFYKKYATRGKLFQRVSDAVKDSFIHLCTLIGQGVPVRPLHDSVGTVAAILHYEAVRDADSMGIADIVMPELVE